MNRRELLWAALGSGAALTLPDLAFAGVDPQTRRALLGEAWERAVRGGRPLLVIVVPEVRSDVFERGHTLGLALNHLDEPNLAPLAGCEPACATLDELDRLVPGVREAAGAWLVLVRVDQAAPTWRSIVLVRPTEIVIPEFHEWAADRVNDPAWKDLLARRPWPEEVRSAWEKDVRALGRQLAAGWNETWRASVTRALWSEGLGSDHDVNRRAGAARKRWVEQNPPGAHWATQWGCGLTYQDVSVSSYYGCGMGYVSKFEQRFLALYDVQGE